MPINKSEEKLIRALKLRKNRNSEKLFIAEGEKLVSDLLQSGIKNELIFFLNTSKTKFAIGKEVTEKEMKEISNLSSPPQAFGVFQMPETKHLIDLEIPIVFAVHQLQDPGNLGTIIRTLDWFGPIPLILLEGSVDPFNPKTVQASMGSVARLPIYTATENEFENFLLSKNYQLLAAHMHGLPFEKIEKSEKFCIVIGNEGKGLEQFNLRPDAFISIPPASNSKGESLNASIAAGILAYECSKL